MYQQSENDENENESKENSEDSDDNSENENEKERQQADPEQSPPPSSTRDGGEEEEEAPPLPPRLPPKPQVSSSTSLQPGGIPSSSSDSDGVPDLRVPPLLMRPTPTSHERNPSLSMPERKSATSSVVMSSSLSCVSPAPATKIIDPSDFSLASVKQEILASSTLQVKTDIELWLEKMHMDKTVIQIFLKNNIKLEDLPKLEDEYLTSIGIKNWGTRFKIMNAAATRDPRTSVKRRPRNVEGQTGASSTTSSKPPVLLAPPSLVPHAEQPAPAPVMRRFSDEEAAIMIQKVWRGYTTRQWWKEVGTPRQIVCMELTRSEDQYASLLTTLKTVVLDPLAAGIHKSKPLLTQYQISNIFGNILDLCQYSTRLAEKLHDNSLDWNKCSCLGKVFVDLIRTSDFLNAYELYVSSYIRGTHTLQDAILSNTKFKNFAKICEKQLFRDQSSTLPAFLVLPVQRLSRYVTMLMQFRDNTEPHHLDYENLENAVSAFQILLQKAKESQIRSESELQKYRQLQQFTKILSPKPKEEFVSWDRYFVDEGDVLILDPETGQTKKRHYLLFNDRLLLTDKPASSKKKQTVKLSVELRSSRVRNLVDGQDVLGHKVKNAWEMHSGTTSMVVTASDASDKARVLASWNNTITLLADHDKDLEKRVATHQNSGPMHSDSASAE
ncbi:hypothetical protein Pelo_1872 [Pelomyxa schiedti]|nr:hypothetical protein Pelo_1872 [Pelomyxa schiedti]